MKKYFLIIGASGYAGTAIANQLTSKSTLITTHNHSKKHSESIQYNFFKHDITQKIPIASAVTVIFAAMVENNVDLDIKAPMRRLASVFADSRFVYISSDAVFSGKKGHYNEIDTPDAKSKYGKNLIQCEEIVKNCVPNHCIIRPSYLYGFNNGKLDKRLAETKSKLCEGRKVKLYDDMFKSPLDIGQFAEAVVQMATSDYIGTIHIAGYRSSVYEFHLKSMKALGVDTTNLFSESLPERSFLAKDTSLDITNWKRLNQNETLSIEGSLRKGRIAIR